MINPLMRSSPARIMGLSSGLDTDSLISQMMKVHQMRIDSKMRSRTLLEWKQNTHNDIKSQISDFRNTFLRSTGASGLLNRNMYNSTVASVTGQFSNAVTIRTGLDSSVGTMRIGQVLSLAKGTSITSASSVTSSHGVTGAGLALSTKLGDINLPETGQIAFDSDDTTTVTINGVDITLSKNDTISSMLSKVNNSSAGVTMSYDRLADKFSIEKKNFGTGTLDLSGSAFDVFGLSSANEVSGTKAQVYINDEIVESATNTFNYRGVSITLNQTTSAANGTGLETDANATVVTLKRDATEALGKIKSFVEAYNSIIKRIEGLVKERKTSTEASYLPLTQEEKNMMSDKQIEEWEAIAKKGILRNDAGLQRLANNLRTSLFESVEAAGLSPSAIGLTTGSFFGGTGGQIVLDEDKLRAALEEDPEKVANVFAGVDGNRGLLYRMNQTMGDYINVRQTRELKGLEDSIKRANEQMEKMQQKMYEEEDKLYRQFAAMETALSKLQQQGDWFTAMLGTGK